jgi:glycosyltransferase involved in cell wall biosynthesis
MSDENLPLVSCITPTANRRAFVPLAIRHFLEQDYPHRELIVLDDGDDPVADLMPADSRVRYVRLDGRRTLGAKRNACVEASRGDLILHWDDDDWSAPHRIRYQVDSLLRQRVDLCGLSRMLFYELASGRVWLYSYPGQQRPWLAGGSLLYTRDYWRRAPFPAISSGEDTRFVWSQPAARAAALTDYTFYVAMIHPGNTSRKYCVGPSWSPWQGDLPPLMGPALQQYAALTQPVGAPARDSTPAPARHLGGTGMKLNLGCCDTLLPDYVNVDLFPGPGVEVVDLREPWPWGDSSVEYVRAWDVVEHLPDKVFTMNELWRVLVPGGTAEIVVPTTDGFLYYEAGNPYRERFACHYGIQARFRTLREQTERTVDGPRLTIVLQAVKS